MENMEEMKNVENVENINVENIKQDQHVTAKVTKIMCPPDDAKRISIFVDKTFKSYNKDGEEVDTDVFSIDIHNLVKQLGEKAPYIQLADSLALGKRVNPKIISLCLLNAEISFTRQHHEEGEEREIEGTYSKNCWVTTITDCKSRINRIFEPIILNLIQTEPAIVEKVGSPMNVTGLFE